MKHTFDYYGLTFKMEKEGGLWVVREEETNGRVVSELTLKAARKKAIEVLEEHGEEETLEAKDKRLESIAKNKLWGTRSEQFLSIFGFHPPRCPISGALSGNKILDVVRLDSLLHTPDGVSTHDHIQNTYGDGALKLVESMM